MKLRALEPDDINLLYAWENDPQSWRCSAVPTPYSRHVLEQYILASETADIWASRQLRLIGEVDGVAVGCADLTDLDPIHHRACVGILVDPHQRGKGYAQAMLHLLAAYAATHLQLHQLYCDIAVDNTASVKAFQSAGFSIIGTRKDWVYNSETKRYTDAYTLQTLFN